MGIKNHDLRLDVNVVLPGHSDNAYERGANGGKIFMASRGFEAVLYVDGVK